MDRLAGFYGDELAGRLRTALERYSAEKRSNPQTAQRDLAKAVQLALPRAKGGRPRSAVYDRAQQLYESDLASGRRRSWTEITKAADPSYEGLKTHAQRRSKVRLVQKAVHTRRSRQNNWHKDCL